MIGHDHQFPSVPSKCLQCIRPCPGTAGTAWGHSSECVPLPRHALVGRVVDQLLQRHEGASETGSSTTGRHRMIQGVIAPIGAMGNHRAGDGECPQRRSDGLVQSRRGPRSCIDPNFRAERPGCRRSPAEPSPRLEYRREAERRRTYCVTIFPSRSRLAVMDSRIELFPLIQVPPSCNKDWPISSLMVPTSNTSVTTVASSPSGIRM